MKLGFWLSTEAFSGGAKVFLEHARRLAERGHDVSVTRGPEAPRGHERLVVTRYRDVLPAIHVAPRVVHLIQGLDVAEGSFLARWRKRARVGRAFAAPTEKIAVARHLAARFPGSLLAPTGVDLSVFRPGEHAPRRVLISGIGPTKQIPLALRALERVRGIEIVHLDPRARLVEGEAAKLIRSARVYLSTVSREEGFDLVALEAMASGVACVLSGGGAHEELAPDLVVGFDPSLLGDSVTRALDDDEEHARRVRVGLDVARKRDWRIVLEHVEAAYRDVGVKPR